MSNVCFVKVRNDQGEIYGSYDIFWDLVELSGFATCELDEVVQRENGTFIFTPTNGNVAACCESIRESGKPLRLIHWNLEIPKGDGTDIVDPWFDETWVSCRYHQSVRPGSKFVALGGDPGLVAEPKEPKRYDFCHLAYLYGKRAEQVAALEAQGFVMAPVGFGDVRDEAIAYSRWGLILHQNPVPALSPQRMTLFACRKLPMVMEEADPYPYHVAKLAGFNREVDTRAMVEANYTNFTQLLTFKNCVEGALE